MLIWIILYFVVSFGLIAYFQIKQDKKEEII
jgi:hypothetical protein